MRIYTKTGDQGSTGLVGGSRIPKNSSRIAAIGDVDELNACVGIARTHLTGTDLDRTLERIQNWLFDLGAELASPPGGRIEYRIVSGTEAEELERSMDAQSTALPSLRNFILPGGCPAGAALHLARSVCRRAERSVLTLNENEPVRAEVLILMNRLSDWLFVAARTANALAGVRDNEWTKQEG